jgi:hypothetical protein
MLPHGRGEGVGEARSMGKGGGGRPATKTRSRQPRVADGVSRGRTCRGGTVGFLVMGWPVGEGSGPDPV